MKKILKNKKILMVILGIILVLLFSIFNHYNKVKDNKLRENMKENLQKINTMCNEVIGDIEGSEKKYLDLLKDEENYLNKGIYSSVISQIYTVKGDVEGIIKYGKDAIENYKKIPGGEYLAISESKYLAWSMLRIGQYGESFSAANDTLNTLKLAQGNLLTEEEIIETEALLYSIFTVIYSEFDLLDNAKFYYDKLEAIEKTERFDKAVGERVYYSQMMYAEKIEDYDLMKKYAEKNYNIALENDAFNGSDTADASILNLAISNISLGNFDEGFKQLKQSEKFFEKIGDIHTLGSVYAAYGEGYGKIKNINKALENYDKALKLYDEIGDKFRKRIALDEVIEFSVKNNINNELAEKYKLMYELEKEVKEGSQINQLLGESLAINEKMSRNRIESVVREKELIETRNSRFLLVIVILILMCYLIWRLYEKKRISERKLEKIANMDYLTGANSRDYGFKEIGKLIKSKTPFSLAMIDIDNFKNINDTYGHLLGDEVLKTIAEKLKEKLGDEHILIRFGGEEFIIIFKNLNKNQGKLILDEVREEIRAIEFRDNVNVSFSGGIDEFITGDINNTIGIVDKLLYIAKNNGKNKVILG